MSMVLPILADVANGIFATVIAGAISNTDVLWWHFIIGIALAMLPDFDALPELFRRGKVAASRESGYHDHREYLHYPILFFATGGLVTYFSLFWGALFIVATALHFINDLYGTGWGIPLSWPLTGRRYKLLGRRANRLKRILVEDGDWDTLSNDERRLRFLVSWKQNELHDYIARWGVENWIERYYLRINWISSTEYILFVLSVILLVYVLVY